MKTRATLKGGPRRQACRKVGIVHIGIILCTLLSARLAGARHILYRLSKLGIVRTVKFKYLLFRKRATFDRNSYGLAPTDWSRRTRILGGATWNLSIDIVNHFWPNDPAEPRRVPFFDHANPIPSPSLPSPFFNILFPPICRRMLGRFNFRFAISLPRLPAFRDPSFSATFALPARRENKIAQFVSQREAGRGREEGGSLRYFSFFLIITRILTCIDKTLKLHASLIAPRCLPATKNEF